jgi:hypothetical protein
MIDLNKYNQPNSTHYAAPAVELQSIQQRVEFLHQALESPAKTTLLAALKRGFLTNVHKDFTAQNVRKYHFTTPEEAKGHLDLQRQRKTPSSKTRVPSTSSTDEETGEEDIYGARRKTQQQTTALTTKTQSSIAVKATQITHEIRIVTRPSMSGRQH